MRFQDTHEWISNDGKIGVSSFAASEVGEVVYIDLPSIGDVFKKGDSIAELESVKSVNDIYAPVDCTVVEVNDDINDDPSVVNSDSQGDGWFIKVQVDNVDQLNDLCAEEDYSP